MYSSRGRPDEIGRESRRGCFLSVVLCCVKMVERWTRVRKGVRWVDGSGDSGSFVGGRLGWSG